jgi:hypothetical protein
MFSAYVNRIWCCFNLFIFFFMASIFVISPHCRLRVLISIIFIVFEQNVKIILIIFIDLLLILVDGLPHVVCETHVFCLFFDKDHILYVAAVDVVCKLCRTRNVISNNSLLTGNFAILMLLTLLLISRIYPFHKYVIIAESYK